MTAPRALLPALAAFLATIGLARGGHEVPVYPSYYPHQITLTSMAPEGAGALLADARLHAYIGPPPRFAGNPPPGVRAVESLGNFIVVRGNAEPPSCATIDAVLHEMAGHAGFVFHPYPVTPLHGDYLIHADRAEAEKARLLAAPAPASAPRRLRVKAMGPLAALVRPDWLASGEAWDAAIEAVDAAALVTAARTSLNGWLGPPWIKTGAFMAASLFGEAGRLVDRLESGGDEHAVERANFERDLVAALNQRCDRRVAGYTVKSEYLTAEFTNGIENIAFDAVEGLQSPIFIRTVKLKNFPWNGELALGVATRPEAAWNPVAGFNDGLGRLLWAALGDPALIPTPYDAGWMLNRIADVQENSTR